jgi:hypothetical protein
VSGQAPTARIAALYVDPHGVYAGLPDVDVWHEERDARLYEGPWPVVAHPPCQRWCRFAKGIEKQYPHYRVGDDGGCFEAALNAVRTFGGVLEHPAHSLAWPAFGLPVPYKNGGWVTNIGGGWAAYVEQGRYGHPMRKATWLYATTAIELRWGHTPDNAVLGRFKWGSRLYKPEHDHERPRVDSLHSATPLEFRDALLDLARSSSREEVAACVVKHPQKQRTF